MHPDPCKVLKLHVDPALSAVLSACTQEGGRSEKSRRGVSTATELAFAMQCAMQIVCCSVVGVLQGFHLRLTDKSENLVQQRVEKSGPAPEGKKF